MVSMCEDCVCLLLRQATWTTVGQSLDGLLQQMATITCWDGRVIKRCLYSGTRLVCGVGEIVSVTIIIIIILILPEDPQNYAENVLKATKQSSHRSSKK